MKRKIYKQLIEWKNTKSFKPLNCFGCKAMWKNVHS